MKKSHVRDVGILHKQRRNYERVFPYNNVRLNIRHLRNYDRVESDRLGRIPTK